MRDNKILDVTIPTETRTSILYKIKKYIKRPVGFFHIVSLNPENLVVAQEIKEFKKVLETAQIKLIDGVGIVLTAQILGVTIGERLTGVELLENLLNMAGRGSLRVLLIGGRPNLALSLSKCYQDRLPQAKFKGYEGIKNIKNPQKEEEKKIFSIVADYKPHLVFAAFGSPWQELWIDRHKRQFKGTVCMGVGQGFDVAGGVVQRAPVWVQNIGFEWLYRLLTQPWRWKRQLRLVKFLWLVLKEKF